MELVLISAGAQLPEGVGGHDWAWRLALDALFMDAQAAQIGRLECFLGLPGIAAAIRDRAQLSGSRGDRVAAAWLGVHPDVARWEAVDRVYVLQYRPHWWAPRPAHPDAWQLEWQRAIYPPAARLLGIGMWATRRARAPYWHDQLFRRLPESFAAPGGPSHYWAEAWAPPVKGQ